MNIDDFFEEIFENKQEVLIPLLKKGINLEKFLLDTVLEQFPKADPKKIQKVIQKKIKVHPYVQGWQRITSVLPLPGWVKWAMIGSACLGTLIIIENAKKNQKNV